MADQRLQESERPFCPACDLNINACTCEFQEVDGMTLIRHAKHCVDANFPAVGDAYVCVCDEGHPDDWRRSWPISISSALGAVSAVDALAAALDHALRDPDIAHCPGWQEDARKALTAARRGQ